MPATRKITVHVSEETLRRAQQATQLGVTATVTRGLELLGADRAYRQLLEMRGTVQLSLNVDELRQDRE